MAGYIRSRKDHSYSEERLTPIEEIPPEHRYNAPLPGGGSQVLDNRLCYNFEPGNKRYVECGSVWSHAEFEGFTPPTEL